MRSRELLLLVLPAMAGAQNYLYVSSLSTDASTAVTTYNAADRSVVAATGARAGGFVLSPDGRTLYVTDANGASVAGYPAGSAAAVGGANTGSSPVAAAVTPNGATLLVANHQSGSVSLVNARSFASQGAVATGFQPVAIVVHPDGEEAFVAHQNGGDVAVIALTGAPRVLRRFAAGASPSALAFLDADTLLVLDSASESILRLNRTTGARLGEFDAGPEAVAMALTRDGRRLYVSNANEATVRVFNPASGAAMGTITLPACPWPRCAVMALALSPDGGTLYAASSNTNAVHAVNLSDNSLAASFTVPSGPRWLAVGPVPPRN